MGFESGFIAFTTFPLDNFTNVEEWIFSSFCVFIMKLLRGFNIVSVSSIRRLCYNKRPPQDKRPISGYSAKSEVRTAEILWPLFHPNCCFANLQKSFLYLIKTRLK